MTAFGRMTTAEYRAYLQSLASGRPEPSEKTGELPASHFGRMSAEEYRALLKAEQQPSGPQPKGKEKPRKKALPPVPTESEEQQAVMEWAEAASGRWPELRLLYHVPNEGQRSMTTGGRLRAEGLKSGVPDLCLPSAHGQYHGLYIEMKRTQGSKTTPEQKEWLEALEAEGYKTVLCKGADAAIETIGAYLALPKKKRASGPINRTESPEAYEMEIKMDFEQKAIVPPKYYLTPKACNGILRRAERRGKPLPEALESALRYQAEHYAEIIERVKELWERHAA